jgi:hypothetical protein
MNTSRFKIDFHEAYRPFALFYRKWTWRGEKWARVDVFDTKEAAKEFYDKIKDLPEYLD